MTCDDVRDLLAEHVLGTLEPGDDRLVAAHLRGCASCRADMGALDEGVGSFARASPVSSRSPTDRRSRRDHIARSAAHAHRLSFGTGPLSRHSSALIARSCRLTNPPSIAPVCQGARPPAPATRRSP